MEEEQNENDTSLGGLVGGSLVASAASLVALIDALSKQPGIDGEQLVKDFMENLPARGEGSFGAELLYQSIERLMGGNGDLPPLQPLQPE